MRRLLVSVLVLAVAATVALLLTSPGRSSHGSTGALAPDLPLPSLSGRTVSLRSFRGHTVVVNFWATWCIPCRAELPRLEGWYAQLRGRGLVILGVDEDESAGAVRAFVRSLHVRYPVLLDGNGDLSLRYRVTGLPTSVLIAPDGTVRGTHVGAVGATFRAQILTLLRPPSRR